MWESMFSVCPPRLNQRIHAVSPPRWGLDRADWSVFERLAPFTRDADAFPSVDAVDHLRIFYSWIGGSPYPWPTLGRPPVSWWWQEICVACSRSQRKTGIFEYRLSLGPFLLQRRDNDRYPVHPLDLSIFRDVENLDVE